MQPVQQQQGQQQPSLWQRFLNSIGTPGDPAGEQQWDSMVNSAKQNPVGTMAAGVDAQKQYMQEGYGKSLPAVTTALAPELAPEAGLLMRGALSAGGAAAGTVGGQAIQGQNPLTKQNLTETGINTALAGGSELALGGAGKLLQSKLARGMVNESVGATARDVTYGNPAKALLNENITVPTTGDLEAYKDALRQGLPQGHALEAAGGRTGAVAKLVNTLSPQLESQLAKSTAQIATTDVIDKPLNDAATSIINNRAMTQTEKGAAIAQLGDLQQSLKEGLGQYISPLQANQLKQQIGNRINWAGNIAVTDEVKPAYKAVYGTLKNAVNNAVPEAAQLNERLTNLLSAQTDLEKLMRAEEVGQGKGALGSAVSGIARRAEAVAGRAIPAASQGLRGTQAYVPPGMVAIQQLIGPQDQQ
jgi:hypothetical protein